MTTHSGCSWDYPEDVALAYGEDRGLRLMLAFVRDDDAAKGAVYDEIGDCAQCWRNMSAYLGGMGSSIALGLAESHGGDRSHVIRQLASQQADAAARIRGR
ncbi:hypothetical protein AB4Z39_33340 [Mycobacterium adipatum]|uniref:hypothetical protein n=1 Tax=Mycobacterium adipatum TaxID=1682113 RepID=UPI0034E0A127